MIDGKSTAPVRLTQIDISHGSNGPERTRSDIGPNEIAQQNAFGDNPTGVIH